ncbi:BRO-N domain-containing protein [Alkalibacillus silvisoli]|uniref:Bro-N domain-containing protein n=1 Tax=Alkalibacillus silvisoli TaxID=392823 RepID=A0ABN0ZXM1_9BACI
MEQLTEKMFKGDQLRIIEKDSEPWFVAKDVCNILGLTKVNRSLERLSDKQKGLHTMSTPGGMQEMNVINEAGLYKLVFTSRKEEAAKFTDWIAEDVVPSIRKTGSFNGIDNLISWIAWLNHWLIK